MTESYSNSVITNNEEKISMFSTLDTIESHETIIKQHQSPSTSAAAIAAAQEAIAQSTMKHELQTKEKSLLKKSSAFFNDRILRKNASVPQDIHRKRSSAFIIKQETQQKKSWWRSLKKSLT